MKRFVLAVAGVLGIGVVCVVAHLALIEIGREVIVLRTREPSGEWLETRIWIVDDGDVSWLHGGDSRWVHNLEARPIVEMERAGETHRYRAEAVSGPHPRVDALLREKYGVADRWVRFVGPDNESTKAVRLSRVESP